MSRPSVDIEKAREASIELGDRSNAQASSSSGQGKPEEESFLPQPASSSAPVPPKLTAAMISESCASLVTEWIVKRMDAGWKGTATHRGSASQLDEGQMQGFELSWPGRQRWDAGVRMT